MTQPNQSDRVIVGITGMIYAIRALDILETLGIETHLIVTRAAGLTRAYETGFTKQDLESRADYVHNINDVGAPMSSRSFLTPGPLILPPQHNRRHRRPLGRTRPGPIRDPHRRLPSLGRGLAARGRTTSDDD